MSHSNGPHLPLKTTSLSSALNLIDQAKAKVMFLL
ncbi:hypothetical protein IAD21_01821 [Abditibacteriota bacterium]|nr:hypothetical protein IAD21_01821 [Abditibacteriota bacterium]